MHVEMSMLKSPEDVLRLAKEEKCLHDLERITFFCAAEGYCRLRANGKVRGDELLFVNSIASEYMTDEECREFRQRYLDIRSQLVLEITEQEFWVRSLWMIMEADTTVKKVFWHFRRSILRWIW